jgi:hypothetical protein
VIAVVDHLDLRKDIECYREFKIGAQVHKRYSQKALENINSALQKETADVIWAKRHTNKAKI